MYNLKEYNVNYSKTSRTLQHYYRYEPSLNNDDNIVNFTGANHNSNSLNLNKKTLDQMGANKRKKC